MLNLYTSALVHTHARMHSRVNTHTHICTHTCTHVHAYMLAHACAHAHVQTQKHMYVNTCFNSHAAEQSIHYLCRDALVEQRRFGIDRHGFSGIVGRAGGIKGRMRLAPMMPRASVPHVWGRHLSCFGCTPTIKDCVALEFL